MPKYTATIAFNVPYYAEIEIEAATDEEAIKIAKDRAARADSDNFEASGDLADDHRIVDVKRGGIYDEDGEIIAEGLEAEVSGKNN